MCHGGCGTLLHVRDGKIVEITGDPDSPQNKGKICPKAVASLEHLYHPDRLTHPLRRVGDRGAGKWERIFCFDRPCEVCVCSEPGMEDCCSGPWTQVCADEAASPLIAAVRQLLQAGSAVYAHVCFWRGQEAPA